MSWKCQLSTTRICLHLVFKWIKNSHFRVNKAQLLFPHTSLLWSLTRVIFHGKKFPMRYAICHLKREFCSNRNYGLERCFLFDLRNCGINTIYVFIRIRTISSIIIDISWNITISLYVLKAISVESARTFHISKIFYWFDNCVIMLLGYTAISNLNKND